MTATDDSRATDLQQGTVSAADGDADALDGHEAVLAPLGERFEHVRVLGRGGMGVVHLARDGQLDRLVAIKRIAVSGPVAGSRLHREARLAAKIEHRNVVAVYDVSVAEDAIYILSEYIEGKGLHQVETPVPWAKALAWGLDLARGLAAAHERGVLHRDIKPANAILDERTQQAKLIDFGVATLVDDDTRSRAEDPLRATTKPDGGAVSSRAPNWDDADDVDEATDTDRTGTPRGARPGTPRYQAPEIWDGQPASTRTDVYALGALLYELCTGQKPRVMAEPDTRHALQIADEDVDPRFAHIVNRCLELDPARRYASGTELAGALAELHAAPVAPENPYRGLLCFHERHRSLFFGRELDTARIVERVRVEPFLLLVGESGVGKSSLAHAGVLPRLRRELDPDRAWTIHAMVPGRRPLTALRRALQQQGETGMVLFIDQLEELLTVSEPEEAQGAQALLARLIAGQDGPGGRLDAVRVLAAVRGDYLTRVAEMPELGGLLEKHIYLVRALDPAGIRAAIVQPARKTGVAFESDALVEELQQATMRARGGMPLLQFALAELWAARDAARGVITRQSLDEIGGVAGALARYADAVLAELPRREQHAAAQRILTRLVAVHHRTQKRCIRSDLVGEDAIGQEVLERLVDRRLVVCHQAEGEWVYSIAHEALLTAWPTLRGWLDRESELLTLRGHLADAALQWQALQRSREALWGRRLVRAARRIDGDELSVNEAAFLAASRRAVLRARGLVWGSVLLVLVLGAGIYAVSRDQARRELDGLIAERRSEARRTLDQASTLRKAYFDVHRRVQAMLRADEDWLASWQQALTLDPQVVNAYRKASEAAEAAYGLDPGEDGVRQLLARVLEERARFADATGRHEDREDLLERLALVDAERTEPWHAPVPVTVTTIPRGGTVEIRRYVWRPDAPFETEAIEMAEAPFETRLAPGSYLAIVQASEGRAEVRYPLEIRPGTEANAPEEISISRPRAADVPAGFVYVSEGQFWAGYGQIPEQDEYRDWHEASPLHLEAVDAYLIRTKETTYREWLEYVDECTQRACPGGAPARVLMGRGDEDFVLEVEHEPGRGWQIHWKPDPTQDGYRARAGEDLVYEERVTMRNQDWREFPVSGVSWLQVQGYLAWLREVRGIRGADLCTEMQWERAARGADARLYPHGNGLTGADANIDKTYGQVQGAFGPDMVGAHPGSTSPFGVQDMAGNIAEMTRPEADQGETAAAEAARPVVIRGGAFFYPSIDARVFTRLDFMPHQSSAVVGFRVCAAAPRE